METCLNTISVKLVRLKSVKKYLLGWYKIFDDVLQMNWTWTELFDPINLGCFIPLIKTKSLICPCKKVSPHFFFKPYAPNFSFVTYKIVIMHLALHGLKYCRYIFALKKITIVCLKLRFLKCGARKELHLWTTSWIALGWPPFKLRTKVIMSIIKALDPQPTRFTQQ